MMAEPHWTDRLSEYLDGEMTDRERAVLEAHLARCPECAATLEELRAVVGTAHTLPEPPVPEDLGAELWKGIAPRLRPRRSWLAALRDAILPAPGPARRLSLSVPQLAVAAVAIAVVSAGTAWWMAGRGSAPATPSPGTVVHAPPSTVPGSSGTLPAGFDAPRYAAAVAELEKTLDAHRSELDPETVKVLEANLATIDRAVDQARRALLADPANPYLNGHLADQMRWKLRVLQRATMAFAANG